MLNILQYIENGSHFAILGYVSLEVYVRVLLSPSVGLFSVSVVLFDVFTAMSLKNVVLRRVTPCNLLSIYRHIWCASCLHNHGSFALSFNLFIYDGG